MFLEIAATQAQAFTFAGRLKGTSDAIAYDK